MKINFRVLSLVILLTVSFSGYAAIDACKFLVASKDVRGNVNIKLNIAADVAKELGVTAEEILPLIQTPKKPEHGDYAIPVFAFAKKQGERPDLFASKISSSPNLVSNPLISELTPVAGFINIKLSPTAIQKSLEQSYRQFGAKMGHATWADSKTVVIDYVSPNIAKPLHIGHFRAAVIGQAIRNLAETQGFKVIGLNHLGDWGIQFGYLIEAFKRWAPEYDFENKPFESIFELYVRSKKEIATNPEFEARGREHFKKMEIGDAETLAIWQKFRKITLDEDQKILDLLRIEHDVVRGEAEYNGDLPKMEENLRSRGLLTESEGAQGVCLDGGKFCLLRTKAGTSVYAARDLVSAEYRKNVLKADESLYVVGNEQKEHFELLFKVLEKMGVPWVNELKHVGFGLYLKDGKKVSSRDGGTMTINELIASTIEQVAAHFSEKSPDLQDRMVVAKQVALGALIFNDLSGDRNNNVSFIENASLNLDIGGPAIQRSAVRGRTILEKYGENQPVSFGAQLNGADEIKLMSQLLDFQEVLTKAYVNHQPYMLAQYLTEVAKTFNAYVQKTPIIDVGNPEVERSRVMLVKITLDVLVEGLRVLNIETPSGM